MKDPVHEVEWWDKNVLCTNMKYYADNDILEEAFKQCGLQKPDESISSKMAIWENERFHETVLQKLKSTTFTNSMLNPKLFETPKIDPATLEEMFKPRTAQPVIQHRLTQEEKKKMVRERRREYQKELQEKIKYGLIPPPPPKVKLNNFMRVLANQAISNPTEVEQQVIKSIEERQQQHKERNETRKLTKEQKHEKMMKKLKKDSSKECRVAIFILQSIHDFKIKAKIKKNAEDLALNGFCLVPAKDIVQELPVTLVVEAGPRYLKFYKRLLLHRIDWTAKRGRKNKEEKDTIENELLEDEENPFCRLVWEGAISDHIFPKWEIKEIRNELEARKQFGDRGVEQYWDAVLSKFHSIRSGG